MNRAVVVMTKMKLLIAICLCTTLLSTPEAYSGHHAVTPSSLFDEYGEIAWEAEKARLDNFAIALQQEQDLIGYVLVYDAAGGCPGEAQARAIRAKRYVVEHRGVPWNSVVWRVEGYQPEIRTVLQPVKRNITLPRPFLPTIKAADGEATKACISKISRISKSKW